jgi:hypothetical protein
LDRDISAILELSVRLENDANCFAISEAIDGAAAGYRVVFGVILGTGVGGGIVIDHRILTGLVAGSDEDRTLHARGFGRKYPTTLRASEWRRTFQKVLSCGDVRKAEEVGSARSMDAAYDIISFGKIG